MGISPLEKKICILYLYLRKPKCHDGWKNFPQKQMNNEQFYESAGANVTFIYVAHTFVQSDMQVREKVRYKYTGVIE